MRDWSQAWALILTAVSFLFGCRRMRREPFERIPLPPSRLEVVRIGETVRLHVDRIRFWSAEMNEPRFILALVPKSTCSDVFILNHGWFDRPEDLLKHLHVDEAYDSLLAGGQVTPAIVAIPDIRFAKFYRQRSSRFPFPNYLTFVGEEVAGTVSRQYSVPLERLHWSIGGFSFGGYLSLDVGRRYPGRFGAVAVISGFTDPEWSFWPAAPVATGDVDERGRGKQTVVEPGPIPRLYLACGENDRLFSSMRKLHERLRAEGIPHAWLTGPGGHTWKYWSSVLNPMLQFALASGSGDGGVK